MTPEELRAQRLANQFLDKPSRRTPAELVVALGAVQAQDYPAALWGLGLRIQDETEASVQKAFNQGKFLRTHVLRPTWHFVSPTDIRWMLDLTAEKIKIAMRAVDKRLGMTEDIYRRSNKLIEKYLVKQARLSRSALGRRLEKDGLSLDEGRLPRMLMHAELDRVICSGPRVGKESTYMLFDQRAPKARSLPRDEALAELADRFFNSHGPATLKDFIWWSGLNISEARKGLESIKMKLFEDQLDGQSFWSTGKFRTSGTHSILLLPNYDEFVIAYADRSAIFDDSHIENRLSRANPIFNHCILINGQLVGNWTRTLKEDTVFIGLKMIRQVSKKDQLAIYAQAERYGNFLGLRLIVSSAK